MRTPAGRGLPGLRRRPVRLRLTVTYGGLFLLAGALLAAFTYALVVHGLSGGPTAVPTAQLTGTFKAECAKALANRVSLGPAMMSDCKLGFGQGLALGLASQRAQAEHQLLLYSLTGLGVMAVLAAAAGWLVAGRALRPVHAITAAARRASQENLGERLALDGPDDELKDLADTYDAMLARLEAAFASQRRFVADASHELRTPLTVMRTAIDVTLAKPDRTPAQLEDMAAEVAAAADQAERLIEALLTLARSDRGGLPREPTDLAVLAEDALDTAAPAIAARSLRVTTALDAGLVHGDPLLLGRLAANLVDNAVRHNQPGGWIQVAAGTRPAAGPGSAGSGAGMAWLAVANGGQVIPAEEAGTLFEPFRRLGGRTAPGGSGPDGSGPGETGPGGSGLGLAIVASVAAAHQGTATARALPAGGLEVTVTLPALPEG